MRHHDWPTRLQQTIKGASGRPFSWGELDCCLFVSDCCIAVCGVDPSGPYRGKYRSRRGAFAAVKRGHGSIEAVLDSHFDRIGPALAGRGDVCLFESPDGLCVGVLFAGEIWAMTPNGVSITRARPTAYWRVDDVKSG
ncbi:hypothetical protein [Salinicola sp. CR57]|uniref:DUF6950 family protein n=1 Tax=Salinicola sp. CR57 TaxID=1949086 RepID=UPI000DA129E0|nr:hypothetical protein [Salinicola sp. CR57]